MLADPVATLKRLARIGFKELESARSDKGNYYGLAPKEIRKVTEDLGMKLRSGHIHVDNDWQKSIDEAAETGQDYLISAVLPTPGQTVENYQRSADAFSKYGEDCKKANLSFGYHNHNTEFEVVDGKILYDILVERSDPKLVKMEMDLGWVVAAGHDPLQCYAKISRPFRALASQGRGHDAQKQKHRVRKGHWTSKAFLLWQIDWDETFFPGTGRIFP